MTEQTETERNEAIETFEKLLKETCLDANEEETFALAISALKQQSEAERRIERVREYCENAIGEELYSLPHTEKEIMYIEMSKP